MNNDAEKVTHVAIKMVHKKQAFQLLEQILHYNKTPMSYTDQALKALNMYTKLPDSKLVLKSTPIEGHITTMLDSVAYLGQLGLTAEDIVVALNIQFNYHKEVGGSVPFEKAIENKNSHYAQMMKLMPVKTLKFLKSLYELIILKSVK